MDNSLHNGDMDDCFGDMLYNYKAEPDAVVWDNIQAQINPLNNLGNTFQNYKVEPDAFVWEKVKTEIAPKPAKVFPYKRVLTVAALLILSVTAGLISWEDSNSNLNNKNLSLSSIETPISESEILIESSEELNVFATEDSQINHKTSKQDYVLVDLKNQGSRSTGGLQSLISNNKSNSQANNKMVNQTIVEAKQFAKSEMLVNERNQLAEGAFYDGTLKDRTLANLGEMNSLKNIKVLPVVNALFPNLNEEKINTEPLIEPSQRKINPIEVDRKNSINAFVGQNFNQWLTVHNEHNEMEEHEEWAGNLSNFSTWSYGFIADFPINQHWSLKTGLMNHRFYSQVSVEAAIRPTDIPVNDLYKEFEVDLIMHNHFYQVMANGRKIGSSLPMSEKILLTSEQSLQYLTVPLWLDYTVNPQQKLKIGLTVGLNANVLLQNKIELLDFELEGAFINGFALSNSEGLKNVNWSYTAGLNLTFPINTHWSYYAQGLYSRSISKINKGDIHESAFKSIGLQTGLKFSF